MCIPCLPSLSCSVLLCLVSCLLVFPCVRVSLFLSPLLSSPVHFLFCLIFHSLFSHFRVSCLPLHSPVTSLHTVFQCQTANEAPEFRATMGERAQRSTKLTHLNLPWALSTDSCECEDDLHLQVFSKISRDSATFLLPPKHTAKRRQAQVVFVCGQRQLSTGH